MAERKRDSLVSGVALALGLGVVSLTGAEAGTGGVPVPQQSAKSLDDLLIWQDRGRIFVSEAGKLATELRFDTHAQAAALRQVLDEQGATAARPHVLRDRIILVGSGGSGFNWDAVPQSEKTGNGSATGSFPERSSQT